MQAYMYIKIPRQDANSNWNRKGHFYGLVVQRRFSYLSVVVFLTLIQAPLNAQNP